VEAIREFQKAEGLTVTGIPDQETLRSLVTDAKTQEFFGLAPEFGEKEQGMEPKPEESKGTPEGTSKPMDRY
jgi:peptidoglycan hydrolase-like protein with peptidoglycan-binding domain